MFVIMGMVVRPSRDIVLCEGIGCPGVFLSINCYDSISSKPKTIKRSEKSQSKWALTLLQFPEACEGKRDSKHRISGDFHRGIWLSAGRGR